MSAARVRPGAMVRVTTPTSPYFGATGHIIGRNEQHEQSAGWIVRIASLGVTITLVEAEFEVVRPRRVESTR